MERGLILLDENFSEDILRRININNVNNLELREVLVEYKNSGMDKNFMLEKLEELRSGCDSDTEDVILDLMDFVTGYCRPDLKIY